MMKSIFRRKIKTLINSSDFRNISLILTIFIIASSILYGHFYLFTQYRMQLIYQNWDGPSYVVIAKSLYNKTLIPKVNTLRLPTEYFAAHPPLYPLLIRLFSFIGFFQSMILVSLLSSALYLITFYYFIKKYTSNKNAFLLSLLSIFVTPRWFAISHTGSSEPLFLFLLTLMIILIRNKKTLIAALVAMLLQLTRIQGILIFGGVVLYYLYQRISKEISTKQFI